MKCKSRGLFPGPKSSKQFNLHCIQWSICQWVNPFPGHVSKEAEQSSNQSEHDKSISSSKRTWPHSLYTYLLSILQLTKTVFLTSVTFNCIQIQSCTDSLSILLSAIMAVVWFIFHSLSVTTIPHSLVVPWILYDNNICYL